MSDFIDTWYQPLIGALHVLGVAVFGATLFTSAPVLRRIGLAWMLATGIFLYLANAERVWASASFRVKLVLIVLAVLIPRPRWLVVALWGAVIFAARGIAYF